MTDTGLQAELEAAIFAWESSGDTEPVCLALLHGADIEGPAIHCAQAGTYAPGDITIVAHVALHPKRYAPNDRKEALLATILAHGRNGGSKWPRIPRLYANKPNPAHDRDAGILGACLANASAARSGDDPRRRSLWHLMAALDLDHAECATQVFGVILDKLSRVKATSGATAQSLALHALILALGAGPALPQAVLERIENLWRDANGTAAPLLHAMFASQQWDDLGAALGVLLAQGVDPDCRGPAGCTPLMVAASSARLDIMETLLCAGADITATDDAGRSVSDYARDVERVAGRDTARITCAFLDDWRAKSALNNLLAVPAQWYGEARNVSHKE